jgi:PAS domain S-box-containing protein
MRAAAIKESRPALRTALAILLIFAIRAEAERLPIKVYTTADGLVRDQIVHLLQDSRGFLWFCTSEGLSRFDGYAFVNYGVEQGLPGREVTDLIETRAGNYWVATNRGLCLLNAEPTGPTSKKFDVYYPAEAPSSRNIRSIFEDAAGTIWCGTVGGVYRLDRVQSEWVFSFVDVIRPDTVEDNLLVSSITEDRKGSLWFASPSGLFRRPPDATVERFSMTEGLPSGRISSRLLVDRDGVLWVGTAVGLYEIVNDPVPGRSIVAHVYTSRDGLARDAIDSLFQSSDGRLWVGCLGLSLLLREPAPDGHKFKSYGAANGLSSESVSAMAEDRDGNLWIGSQEGAMKLSLNGITTYGAQDGLASTAIAAILEDRGGSICVIGSNNTISRFEGGRFAASALVFPSGITTSTWGWGQITFQDHTGEWWMSTGQGLVRYGASRNPEQFSRAKPKAVYTTRDGLTADLIFRLFEDSGGDIWISTLGNPSGVLTRWDRKTQTFHRYTPADGLTEAAPTAFCEDTAGNLWIGLYLGGLLRYHGGTFTHFSQSDGVPIGLIRGLYLDHLGRLWIASSEGGVGRMDQPSAAHPDIVAYTTAGGLSSNQASCVVEDRQGLIYIGTGRGIDRLDSVTGRFKRFTTAEGLASSFVNVSLRDRDGALWFGTSNGLSMYIPPQDRSSPPPVTLISEVLMAGVPYSLSELGTRDVAGPELGSNHNQIQIHFVGVSPGLAASLRYQYRLEGAEQSWSLPTAERSVNYPNLAPGSYSFLVRVVTAEGVTEQSPAAVRFTILPPIWRRWWFVGILTLITALAIAGFVKYRLDRLTALRESETRFRTLAQTASDAIITIDEDGRIAFINKATEHVFGYSEIEMLGNDLTMLMPEYMRALHRQGLSRYKETGVRHMSWRLVELPGLHKNGSEIPLEISFGEFTRGHRKYFTGMARDITERKRAEEDRRRADETLKKSREERFNELQQVRRRIATDLHDDIGSSLTQISILSEVAHKNAAHPPPDAGSDPLARIITVSNELVDTMSDIVWAINPTKDHLADLIQRMRRFASDIFTARNIPFRFRTPKLDHELTLGANVRREVFLIFKETINTVVRHSSCTRVEIECSIEGDWLTLNVSDNGKGYDSESAQNPIGEAGYDHLPLRGGNGIPNMRRRAEEMGGHFEIVGRPGEGTISVLRVPLAALQVEKT